MVAKTALRATVTTVLPMLLAVTGVSAMLAWPVTAWAARRSTRQPVDAHPDAEALLFAHLLAAPHDYPKIAALSVNDFVVPAHQDAWRRVQAACAHVPVPASDDPELDALLTAAGRHVPDLCEVIALPHLTAMAMPDDMLEREGQKVLDAGMDREAFAGLSPITWTDDANTPLVRRYRSPSARRTVAVGVLLVAGFLASILLAQGFTTPLAFWCAVGAGVVVTLGSTLWTLVDLDTLYVDLPTVWPVTIASVALAGAAAWTDQALQRFVAGAAAAGIVLVVLEGTNVGHRLLRGTWGLGGGDKFVIPACFGVPAMLADAWTFGYAALMAALFTAIATWAVLKAADRGGRQRPFAFVPYLATGWVTATVAMNLGGVL